MSAPAATALGLRKAAQPQSGSAQARKLVIKPLKSKPALPTDFEAATWAKLQEAVHAVFARRAVASNLETLYSAVQDMCMHKMADKLYLRLQQEIDSHIGRQLAALRDRLSLDPVAFLDKLDALWCDLCDQLLTIRQIFLYLDRSYVVTSTPARSLFDTGLTCLRTHLDAVPQIGTHAVAGILRLVERERGGETVDKALLASLVRLFNNLGSYATALHRPLVDAAHAWYREEGQRLVLELAVPEYLAHCERRLGEEVERCAQYMDAASRKPLLQTVEKHLIADHLPTLLDKGFSQMMDTQRTADLGRLYVLAGRVGATEAVRAAWRDYIKATGLSIVKDEQKDKEMVELVLGLKARLEAVLDGAFARSDLFANSMKDALEVALNSRAGRPAELIAKFMDGKLRAGNKGMREEELEAALDGALLLFRHLSGKDVFEAFYKKDLAKRLLLGKSASADAEKAVLAKLKSECGATFTSKLEGMFKDVQLSGDVMAAFKEHCASAPFAPLPPLDLNVSVLTSGFWPSYPVQAAQLPQELGAWQGVFMDFYSNKYSGRRLVWHHSLGSCVLRAAFPNGPKELSVSLFQAVVLMLFNDADSLGFEDIKRQSGIDVKELKRTLQSLACGKVRVLLKEPKGRDVGDTDTFSFNAGFTERLFRIKINSIQMKETEEENKKTNEQVMQDRQYQIDAALVRIMKTRKALSHKLLVAEALTQLKFPLKAADLKKRIESLIDREYMARDKDHAEMYHYLA